MKQSRLSSSKLFSVILLLAAPAARGQLQWTCGPVQFRVPNSPYAHYLDESDSTLYIGGLLHMINGPDDTTIIGIRKDGGVIRMPQPRVRPVVITKWQGKLIVGGNVGLAEFNGTSWTRLDSFNAVYSLYQYAGKLLVGGVFPNPAGGSQTVQAMMEWDGVQLSPFKGLDSITKGQSVNSIIEYNGDLIVAGNMQVYPPVDPRYIDILRWTGSSWQPLGNGIPGVEWVTDMKVMNGELYVAGVFNEAGGSPGNNIAKWNGTTWQRLGSGLNNGATDLEMLGDTLIVAGNFSTADGKLSSKLARYWNGHWCTNDKAIDNIVWFAANFYGELYIGGGFWTIGGDSCGRFAKVVSWDDCFAEAIASISSTASSTSPSLKAYPNPASDEVRLEFFMSKTGPAKLTLSDTTGRIITTQTLEVRKGSNRRIVDLKGVPTGLYFIQLSTATGHEAIKIAKQ